jgi:hydrogenase maturation protein HypF
LPGGDSAAHEPYRSAIGLLLSRSRKLAEEVAAKWLPEAKLKLLLDATERGVNAPVTSSAGRLFDAVAAIIGLRSHTHFEGQAAMELEFAAPEGAGNAADAYPFPVRAGAPSTPLQCDTQPLLEALLADVARGTPIGILSGRFHRALVALALDVAERAGRECVVLSGGCFQNRWLATHLTSALERQGHRVLTGGQIPCNDGGISAGQAHVVARLL